MSNSFRIDDMITPHDAGGISAKRVEEALARVKGREVTIYVNSPGGDLVEGFSILSVLNRAAQRMHITVVVDGEAASAASMIAMAAHKVVMAPYATLMIHNGWTVTMGNAAALRKAAADLELLSNNMRDVYVGRCGKSVEQVQAWMDSETRFSAAQAVEHGFADEIQTSYQASSDTFAALPEATRQRVTQLNIQIWKNKRASASASKQPVQTGK